MVISIRRTTAPPSQLVTAIAWISIIGSALGTFGTAVYLVLFTLAPGDVFREAAGYAADTHLPANVRFAMDHLQLFLVITLTGSAVMLITSIGLLRRQEWARTAFVWLLGFAIVSGLAGIIPEFRLAGVASFVAMAGISGAIIWKLCTARVREEFEAAEDE